MEVLKLHWFTIFKSTAERDRELFLFFFFYYQEKELFLSDNIDTNTNTNIKRPLIKEEIVDYGEKTQQTDVGYSRTKTKVETKSSQKNKKEKD